MDVPVIPSEAIKSSSRHLTASQPSGVYPAQSKHLHNYLASEALPSYPGTASAPVLGQNVTENHWNPKADGSIAMMPLSSQLPFRTSLDLELDLQAFHTKLSHLNDEITRLKELKRTLEETKSKGEGDLPDWLSENEKFHRLLAMAEKMVFPEGAKKEYISRQDKRAEQLIRKVTKDVQRMRQGTQQSRTFNFR
uniref:Uncharacterized protein n=1 Tax=Biomphalaria glabrata TaxID=6526 RepID=A0A2C9KVU9_BIOGL